MALPRKLQRRDGAETCDMGNVDVVGQTADLSCLAINTPTEICDMNAVVKAVAEVVCNFCSGSWFSGDDTVDPVDSDWGKYFEDMIAEEVNTEVAIEKLGAYADKQIAKTTDALEKADLTEKKAKKLARVNKFSKGVSKVAGIAGSVCTGADIALKVSTTIESTCLNQMDVAIFGAGFSRLLVWDSLCVSISYGDNVDTGQKESWCNDGTSANPMIGGMNQYQYFKVQNSAPAKQHNMVDITDGTQMCQWVPKTDDSSTFCKFNEVTATQVTKNKEAADDCMDYAGMVQEFKDQDPTMTTFRSESTKVAHFVQHKPGMGYTVSEDIILVKSSEHVKSLVHLKLPSLPK